MKTENHPIITSLLTAVTRNVWFYILTAVALVLIIASFIVPPTGVIDSSVLAASGEIFAFAALGTVIKALDKGVEASVTKGNTELKVSGKQKDNEE